MGSAKGHVRFTPKATLNAFIREGQEDDECGAGLFCASSSVACRIKTAFLLDAVIKLAKRGGRAGPDCGSSAQIARSAGSVIR
jgi:hypothetical protein